VVADIVIKQVNDLTEQETLALEAKRSLLGGPIILPCNIKLSVARASWLSSSALEGDELAAILKAVRKDVGLVNSKLLFDCQGRGANATPLAVVRGTRTLWLTPVLRWGFLNFAGVLRNHIY
jgi:hypothetical protein